MNDRIPDYYQDLAAAEGNPVSGRESDASPDSNCGRDERPDAQGAIGSQRYRTESFNFRVPEGDWRDCTLYTVKGPTVDGLEHRILITTSTRNGSKTLSSYAEKQVESVQSDLSEAVVLRTDQVRLSCGEEAKRAIFLLNMFDSRWYLEQLYLGGDTKWYHVSALFTRDSRRILGDAVERVMLSLTPESMESASERSSTSSKMAG